MNIVAPLPGKIISIEVNVGDAVKQDDEVFIIEAMKMETPIYAPCDGTIKEIKVKVNDKVDTDQVLGVIE